MGSGEIGGSESVWKLIGTPWPSLRPAQDGRDAHCVCSSGTRLREKSFEKTKFRVPEEGSKGARLEGRFISIIATIWGLLIQTLSATVLSVEASSIKMKQAHLDPSIECPFAQYRWQETTNHQFKSV